MWLKKNIPHGIRSSKKSPFNIVGSINYVSNLGIFGSMIKRFIQSYNQMKWLHDHSHHWDDDAMNFIMNNSFVFMIIDADFDSEDLYLFVIKLK